MKKLVKKIERKLLEEKKVTDFKLEKIVNKIINKVFSNEDRNINVDVERTNDKYLTVNIKEYDSSTDEAFKIINDETFYILLDLNDFNNCILRIKENDEDLIKKQKILLLEKELENISNKEKLNKGDVKHLLTLKTEVNLLKKGINIIDTERGTYISNDKNIFRYISKKEIQNIVKKNCGYNRITMEDINEVVSKIKINNYVTEAKFDNVNVNEEIVFNNCIYNFKTNKTRDIKEEELIITYIDSPFSLLSNDLVKKDDDIFNDNIESNEPTKFLKFLNESITVDEINLLQEFLGYTFKLKNDHKNYLLLKGVKNSGKSTINDILQKIIGNDNICSVRPKDLESAEKSYGLKGSLLNLVPELSANEVITDDIKKITSGGRDAITVRRRFEQEETIIPACKTIITTNYDIKFKDDASGRIEVRTLLIDFKKSVPLNKINKNIVNEILADEKNAIINWCIEGLKRLEERGYFDKTLDNKVIIFNKRKNDNLTFKYLVEKIEKYKDLEYVKFNDFKEDYQLWLDNDEGYDFNLTNKSLSKNLNLLNIRTHDTRKDNERRTYIIFDDVLAEIEKSIKEVKVLKEQQNLNDCEIENKIKKMEEQQEQEDKERASIYKILEKDLY